MPREDRVCSAGATSALAEGDEAADTRLLRRLTAISLGKLTVTAPACSSLISVRPSPALMKAAPTPKFCAMAAHGQLACRVTSQPKGLSIPWDTHDHALCAA